MKKYKITHCNHPKDVPKDRFCRSCLRERNKKRESAYWHRYYLTILQSKKQHKYQRMKKCKPEQYWQLLIWMRERARQRWAALPESEKEKVRERRRQYYWENRNAFSKRAAREYYIKKMDHAWYAQHLARCREWKRHRRELTRQQAA